VRRTKPAPSFLALHSCARPVVICDRSDSFVVLTYLIYDLCLARIQSIFRSTLPRQASRYARQLVARLIWLHGGPIRHLSLVQLVFSWLTASHAMSHTFQLHLPARCCGVRNNLSCSLAATV
jgi:hypothetical protein